MKAKITKVNKSSDDFDRCIGIFYRNETVPEGILRNEQPESP